MKNPKYQIFKGKNKKFYFRLKSGNGQNVLQSQGYANKAGVKRGINSVKTNSAKDERFDIKESKNGQFSFNLLAANKNVIGSSEIYKSKPSLKRGMESVRKNAEAPVEDLTEVEAKPKAAPKAKKAVKAPAKTKATSKAAAKPKAKTKAASKPKTKTAAKPKKKAAPKKKK